MAKICFGLVCFSGFMGMKLLQQLQSCGTKENLVLQGLKKKITQERINPENIIQRNPKGHAD